MQAHGTALPHSIRLRAPLQTAFVAVCVAFSLLLGAASVFATRIMRFYQGDMGLHYDWLVLDASITVVMLVILSGIFHLRSGRYGWCMAIGAAAMLTLMHNAVWQFPFFFADLFSHAYVGAVKNETDPMTLWIWVTSFDLTAF
jgi:hypothetical protein